VAEKPIKVDEETDRVVTDLAHFLRSTKKSVVRDAVAEYAESRHALIPTGVRERGAGGRGPGEPGAGEPNAGEPTAGEPGAGESGTGELGAGQEGAGIDGLTPLQRLGLRRKELIREFARHRGTNVRVLEASGEDDADADADQITLLVDTDLIDGGGAAPRLQEIAQRLLATDVTVLSMTALRLMRPERHRRAQAESRPL
jgi:predicted transcriptional regulator